jgi:hypothetical protein
MSRFLVAVVLATLALPARACVLPSQTPMLIVTLYFGESITGRAPLTAVEWARFAAHSITPAFPDGFTVADGEGQWRDPASGQIIQENTKILTIAAPQTPSLAAKLTAVMNSYDKQFNQTSVGITTQEGCGAF